MPATCGRLLLFWDYDTQWGAERSRSGRGPATWGPLEFEGADRVLDMLARRDIRACFAVVGAAALPGSRPWADPDQIRRIHAAGHEVASHAFRHEWLPGLTRDALVRTLRESRDALQACIGAPVTTFVPPFNQPFDYPARGAFSLTERWHGGRERVDIPGLCRLLAECGYRTCRIAYEPIGSRIRACLTRRGTDRPGRVERVAGVCCVRLNTPGGFGAPAMAMLHRVAEEGGIAVVYGHPHSIGRRETTQHEGVLAPFLDRAAALRDAGRLDIVLPRELDELAPGLSAA
ncbi:MAG TPA: polysaccharide deacetylase family protein [Vicinamibacterales bacterium]